MLQKTHDEGQGVGVVDHSAVYGMHGGKVRLALRGQACLRHRNGAITALICQAESCRQPQQGRTDCLGACACYDAAGAAGQRPGGIPSHLGSQLHRSLPVYDLEERPNAPGLHHGLVLYRRPAHCLQAQLSWQQSTSSRVWVFRVQHPDELRLQAHLHYCIGQGAAIVGRCQHYSPNPSHISIWHAHLQQQSHGL